MATTIPISMPRLSWRNLDYTKAGFFTFVTVMSGVAVWWSTCVHFSAATLAFTTAWYVLCGISITSCYHRWGAHRTYDPNHVLLLAMLILSAGAIQMPLWHYASRHRWHHVPSRADHPTLDPYPMCRGFWYAHIWCVIFRIFQDDTSNVPDLDANRLVIWQKRRYWPLVALVAFIVPTLFGAMWGDSMGSFLWSFPRLWVLYNAAFAVNSFAHWQRIGYKRYIERSSAVEVRNRFLWFVLTLATLGEVGGHDFHHAFQADWRTDDKGRFNPTTIFLRLMVRIGLVTSLHEVPAEAISRKAL